MITLYTDAATNPKTKVSACGVLIIENNQQQQLKFSLPTGDNHESEFRAAIKGFEALIYQYLTPSEKTVRFYTDSQLLADSIQKRYAKHYQALLDDLLGLQDQFAFVLTQWVPEKQNQGAHNLALQELHSQE